MAARKRSGSKEPAPLKFPPDKELASLFARVLKTASKLPGVEESRSYGTPAIKVKGKLMARLRSEQEGGLAVRCDLLEREMLLTAAPDVFFITDHYNDYPWVLVNLRKVRWDAMEDLLEKAWRAAAPATLVKKYDNTSS